MSHSGPGRGSGGSGSSNAGRTTPRSVQPRIRQTTPQSQSDVPTQYTVKSILRTHARPNSTARSESSFATPTTASRPGSARAGSTPRNNGNGFHRPMIPIIYPDEDGMTCEEAGCDLDPAVLADYEPPQSVLVFEEMVKARADFRKKHLEAESAKLRAQRNQMLDPKLCKLAKDNLETLNSALETFYDSSAFKELSKPKERRFVAEKELAGIPCPVELHGDLIDAFKAMGEMNLILKDNPMNGVDAESISEFIQESQGQLGKKLSKEEELYEKAQSSLAVSKDLNANLAKVIETKERFRAQKLENH